jgi:hypothetical protein
MKLIIAIALGVALFTVAYATVPTTLLDFFMPGSQPNESSTLEATTRCMNCHSNYNPADPRVEPGSNWAGSMMSQAARDPLFYACLAVANQDATDVGDMCIRCHTPKGWIEGRSVPTNGSALTAADRDGVHCDSCHRLVKPSPIGINPYPLDSFYTANTYPRDQAYLSTISSHIPPTEANGMYVLDSQNDKRGPYSDPAARHGWLYSPFHRRANICGTCHDVSNPVFDRQPDDTYKPNAFGQPRTNFDPYSMGPVERTYSEWKNSAYNNGSEQTTCQGCHMADLNGKGCDKSDAPVRTDLPWHDMTGGNTWIPDIINQFFPGEADTTLLARGKTRALATLRRAASVAPRIEGANLIVRVTNYTGHKLPSGYPEGRRIWLNVKFKNTQGVVIQESGKWDFKSDTVKHTFGFGSYPPGSMESVSVPTIIDHDTAKVYEIHLGLSNELANTLGLPPGPSFHFVLNDTVFFDNRIPPAGFTNSAFRAIQSQPVGYTYADGQNWDDTVYPIPDGAVSADIKLYYQTSSYEYIKFLLEENYTNNFGERLFNEWRNSGYSAPVEMASASIATPKFFSNISSARAQPNGTLISLPGRTITAAFGSKFYIEEPDRSAGIGVVWNEPVTEGSAVSVVGTLSVNQGEREIIAQTVTPSTAAPIKPLGMNLRALGGGDIVGQSGPAGGVGLNNVCMLVKVAGKVKSLVTDGFVIDDGSGVYAEVYAPGLIAPLPGSKVAVTGISGLGIRNFQLERLIRVRRQSDITVY